MTVPPEQQEVAHFLSGLAGGPPRETHISAVFIGNDTVWKLKKSVRLSFLDFTTADSRRHFLNRELELNKPGAPGIYRDVVAVTRQQDGSLRLGDDHPVDWVLRMARVPDGDFLNEMAEAGALTPKHLDDLGDCVAAYHARLPPVREWDSATAMLRVAQGNASAALAAGLPRAEVDAWRQRTEAAIEARRLWLGQRAAAGYVRRCHGDLHLGNICLWDGMPVPFDALEFDEALATIDVGYDIAFLLMDIEQRIGRGAANRVINRYVARTGDVGATAGFPLFLSQRAMVRAHVLQAMNQRPAGLDLLTAALAYLTPPPPLALAIGGLQGTGKSTLARALAPELGPAPGALILRSDEIRKRLHGAAPEKRLPPKAYTEAANTAVNHALIEAARIAAEAGHGMIADATFLDVAVRQRLAATVRQTGMKFLGVWLEAPMALLEQRIGSRHGDASDATICVLHRAAASAPGAGDWLPVDATDAAEALGTVRHAAARAISA